MNYNFSITHGKYQQITEKSSVSVRIKIGHTNRLHGDFLIFLKRNVQN